MTKLPRELAAADRNRDAVFAVLREVLPSSGTILEIASGGGQHAAHFAAGLPGIVWQPSDANPDRVALMVERFEDLGLSNLRAPVLLDVGADVWPFEDPPCDPPVTGIVNVNMIQVAPWSICQALFAGAARLMPDGGVLYLYGPFMRDGVHMSEGNAEFDQSLRARNPEWGLRDLSDVCDAAAQAGLKLDRVVEMPVNNLSVVFRAQA
tara:strand:- start:13907 stop:14530 length:624 start_codon:yes stop_codon:yes gene_type:complete